MQKRRYPGVSPFTSEQKDIFFGRDNDIKRLYKLISMRNQILLYAKSGIGKTSLLNAGVLPKLEKKYSIIKIRFFAYDNENSISPVEKTLNALKNLVGESENSFLDDLISQTNYKKTLWYYFKKLQLSGKQKFILVFDQFEELFSYPQELVNQFKEELHELTNIDIPNAIKQKIAETEESETEEIDVLYEDLDIKNVFAIRSDRLSLLNQLTDKIPDIQETFYELKPLDIEQTKSALVQPAKSEADFETKAFDFSKGAITKIISALSDKGKQNIETTQLQIVCQRIEDIAQEKYTTSLKEEIVSISETDLPEFKDIFLNFYENVLRSAVSAPSKSANEKGVSQIRKFVEDQLIRNNQRISLDAIICRDYVQKEILQKLVNTHLLRAERNSTGGFSYELSHDTLVSPILESRKKRIEKEEEEEKLRIEAEKLRIERETTEKNRIEQEKENKRQRKVILMVGSVAVVAVVAFVFAVFLSFEAKKQTEMAEMAKNKSEKAMTNLKEAQLKIVLADAENSSKEMLFDEAVTILKDGYQWILLENDSLKIVQLIANYEQQKIENEELLQTLKSIEVFIQNGKYSQAISLCSKSLEKYPKNENLLLKKGKIISEIEKQIAELESSAAAAQGAGFTAGANKDQKKANSLKRLIGK